MRLVFIKTIMTCFLGIFVLMQQSCVSQKNPNDNFPTENEFPEYRLIDARYQENLSISVNENSKFAIVVRDLAVTAFSNLGQPRYDSKDFFFAGAERCCAPKTPRFGESGLLVYRFHALNVSDKTTIELIARRKGLDMQKLQYDSDLVKTIHVKIK